MKVAGKKLAKQSLAAHEMGEFRIRAGLKHKGDAHGLGKEHRQHAEERAAAISYVMNTGEAGRRERA